MSDDQRRFRFDQLDRTGILLGLDGFQLTALGVGLAVGALAISLGLPSPVAVVPAGASFAAAFIRIGDRPLSDWCRVMASWVAGGGAKGRRWFAPVGGDRVRVASGTAPEILRRPLSFPPMLDGLRVVEAESPWHRVAKVGLVEDRKDGTLTALVPVRGRDFALLSADEQDDLLGRWGDVLGLFARERGVVSQISWSQFAAPVGLRDHRQWVHGHVRAAPVDEVDAEAVADYDRLLADAGELNAEHSVVVAVTVARSRLRHSRSRPSRMSSGEALVEAAIASTDALIRGLRSAGLQPGNPLTAAGIGDLLGWRSDPERMRRIANPPADDESTAEPKRRRGAAGPLASTAAWSHVRIDGSLHRTFWVAEWPRLPVRADWMEPLLAFTGRSRRAFTMIYEPVRPSTSRRRVDVQSIKLESDAVAKEEKGRRVSAQHRRHQVAIAEREQELVAGYVEFDFTGLVTVSARTVEELWEECDSVEQIAREHGLELRALDGRHDLGWASALPLGLQLGRGLRR